MDELLARQWLSGILEDVRAESDRQRKLGRLSAANDDTVTTGITRRNSELTDRYVTEALCRRFAEEAAGLGAGYLHIQLAPTGGQYGSMRFRVELDGAQRNVNVPAVLSEGEYRCIALAGFLAELATSDGRSGLVFDDPVCSLDHRWRRRVAERLLLEARARQVIILTHDMVFLLDLVELCEQRGVPCVASQMRREEGRTGVCMDGVPWLGMKLNDRLGWLRQELQRAETVRNREGSGSYEPIARRIYARLREAWERAVEEVLLNGVVVRFGRSIQTQRLRHVHDITPEDILVVEEGMTKASRFMEGHDEAGAINEPVPEPCEVRRDVQSLEQWAQGIRRRR